ncbi:MAG: HDOD domain-containing protein [Myxococcota bacterium]
MTNPARLNPNYGKGVHTLDIELASSEEVYEGLKRLFASPDYQPPLLPRAAIRVNELIREPKVAVTDVVAVLQEDPVLAAAMLRRAQSPAYATKVPPRSLQDAASRLGLQTMRDIVWEVAMKAKVFKHPGCRQFMEELGKHSVATGRVMRLVASYTSLYDESAFLVGLLHDIGLVASAHALADDSRRRRKKIDLKEYGSILADCHEDAGSVVAKLWELPPELVMVIGSHHNPVIQGYAHPLIAAGIVAEAIVCTLGAGLELGFQRLSHPSPALLKTSLTTLSIDEKHLERLVEKSRPLLQ